MAYDGLIIADTVKELREAFLMGSITKIVQPEPEELLLTVKNNRKNMKLYISANASLPVVYITEEERPAFPEDLEHLDASQAEVVARVLIARMFDESLETIRGWCG